MHFHIASVLTSTTIKTIGEDHTGRFDSESDSDDESGQVGALAPPLTEQISNILNRYPEGGQILKVLFTLK